MLSSPIAWINREIERQEERKETIDAKIKDLESAKKLALELPDTCLFCKGTGIETYTEPPGSRGTRACKVCRGLGKVREIVCECGYVIGIDNEDIRRQYVPECPRCGRAILVDQYGD